MRDTWIGVITTRKTPPPVERLVQRPERRPYTPDAHRVHAGSNPAPLTMKKSKMKILGLGMKIRTKGRFRGLEGVVTRLRKGREPTSHGMVEFRVTRIDPPKEMGTGIIGVTRAMFWRWVVVGGYEHFKFRKWWRDLEVLR